MYIHIYMYATHYCNTLGPVFCCLNCHLKFIQHTKTLL